MNTKKKIIWGIVIFVAFIALVIGTSYGDIGVEILKSKSEKEIVSLCNELGFENVNTEITEVNEKYDFCYLIKVTANGQFDETTPEFFGFFDRVEEIEETYVEKARYLVTPTRSLRAEFFFNGSEYEERDGIIYKDKIAVNYKTTDIRLKKEYQYKEPQVGMPREALRYTKYGDYRYSGDTKEYYWQEGDYKIYAKISEDKKDFDGFSDYYVADIRKVYSPLPTTKKYTTTKKYYYVPSYNKNPNYDPYDAKNYADAEGFYYDHYDDFWDYEEAEEYFNEHSD